MMSNFISKPLILALFVLMSSTALFTYLSYSFYGDKVEAEKSLVLALSVNSDLQNSLQQRDKACVIDNISAAQFQQEKKLIDKKEKDSVSKINNIPSKAEKHETNIAGIDDRLSPDLIRMLSESDY